MSTAIVLTDCPIVVELKREFRRLDAREQELKIPARAGLPTAVDALHSVRRRKEEIAREIFKLSSLIHNSPVDRERRAVAGPEIDGASTVSAALAGGKVHSQQT